MIAYLALSASVFSLTLLCARLIEHIIWAACPETIHTVRTSDRVLTTSCVVAIALIAASLWNIA